MLVGRLRPAVAALACLAAAPTRAAETCPALFADGRAPVLANPKLAARTVPLCFSAYAVLHSGVTRTPLYAAEHLTRDGVADARAVARDDSFHAEPRLPGAQGASLADYVHSGFDRGHLAPAGDMPSDVAQAQSFSLANIVPQDRVMNRGLWGDIEEGVRRLAVRRGALYVVTGAVFSGDSVRQIGSGVLVPTHLFKALYDPATGEAGAYLARNDAARDWRAVSMQDLQAEAGIDVFPNLPTEARATAMSLPDPQALARGDEVRQRREPRAESWQERLGRDLVRALRRAFRQILHAIF